MIESLEIRRMLSITLANATLTVCGTDDSDVIVVNQKIFNCFEVFENGACTIISTSRIVTKIIINGDEGCDYLALTGCVTAKGYLNGGCDDDTLVGGRGADVFCGGDGCDWADYSWRKECLTLVIGGGPISGAPCERDDIKGDVENLIGGCGNDLIVGDDCANELIGGPGCDTILGLGGDDLLDGCCGNDSLDGGCGCDLIIGGEGSDYMIGGEDDDAFFANDGCYDTVNGGPGCDIAFVDCIDNVGCVENVIFASKEVQPA